MDSLLRELEGVSDVDVDIDETITTVWYDAAKTSLKEIIKTLTEWDFDVEGVEEVD